MRPAALSIPLLALALAGCQAFAPPPDVAAGPHTSLASTHVDVDNDRTDVFRVLEIDGRPVIDRTDLSIKSVEVDQLHLVATGHTAHVAVDALAYYGNTARRLFWDAMQIKGTIDFVPAPDTVYLVRGSLTPERSSVWIENGATHEIVGNKLSAPGRGAAASAAAP
jgi:hypothetical protein